MSKQPLTLERSEEMALRIRSAIGMTNTKFIDGMTAILKFKECGWLSNYKRVPDRQLPDTEAYWDNSTRIITLRESVFSGINRQDSRSRMTLAEELMHCVLGHKGIRNRSTMPLAYEVAVPRIRRDEAEAKRLAAAFLCPEYLVPEVFCDQLLTAEFGLSRQAAMYRTEEIRRVRRRRKGESREVPKFVLDFLQEMRRKK